MWIAKNIFGTAGVDMHCVTSDDFSVVELDDDYILQEGITDLALIDGEPYDRDSTNYDVQINHAGYADKNSPIRLMALDDSDYAGVLCNAWQIRGANSNRFWRIF